MNASRAWLLVGRDENDPAMMLLPQQTNQHPTGDRQPISTVYPMPSYSRLPLICCMFFSVGGFFWLLLHTKSDCTKFIDQDAIENCKEENKESILSQRFVAITGFLVVLIPILRILVLLHCSRRSISERGEDDTQLGLP